MVDPYEILDIFWQTDRSLKLQCAINLIVRVNECTEVRVEIQLQSFAVLEAPCQRSVAIYFSSHTLMGCNGLDILSDVGIVYSRLATKHAYCKIMAFELVLRMVKTLDASCVFKVWYDYNTASPRKSGSEKMLSPPMKKGLYFDATTIIAKHVGLFDEIVWYIYDFKRKL